MSLASKITKAGLVVGGKLSADKTNTEQRYDYISADKILSVCGQALFNQGIAVLPEVTEQITNLFEYTDNYGKARRRYDSTVMFQFTISDGEETIKQAFVGMGSDYVVPDKAVYKAITSGHKYFLMKLLCVGAGNEDREHETEAEPVQPVRPAVKPEPTRTIEYPAHLQEVTNSEGVPYYQMGDEQLRFMAASIRKAMPKADDDKQAQYSLKLDAIKEIQAIRADV